MMRKSAVLFGLISLVGLVSLAATTPPPKPDLRVSEMTVEKVETTDVPLRVRVRFAVHNFGPGNSNSFVSRLTYRKGSSGSWTTFKDYPSPFTPSGGGAYWNPTIDFPAGGTYTFKVEVDVSDQITERNEGNNTKTVTKTYSGGTADLTVVNVDASITRTTSSGTIYTKVIWDVQNDGDGKAAGSFVTVIKVAKNSGSFVELARYTRSNLQAGSSYHFTDNHSFTSVTSVKFKIETNPTHAVHERSYSNNNASSGVLRP